MRYTVFVATEVGLLGVWQDGLRINPVTYEPALAHVALGSHVGNDPYLIFIQHSETYYDWTYNYAACDAATYVATYGATYAATYYRDIACNVRDLEWI